MSLVRLSIVAFVLFATLTVAAIGARHQMDSANGDQGLAVSPYLYPNSIAVLSSDPAVGFGLDINVSDDWSISVDAVE